jgi:hypothetical protein
MLKRITLSLGALLILACVLPALAADPTPAQIYQTARGGNLPEAEQMIAQVLRDQPRSGQAHYVAAQIDARAGNFGLARQELGTAQSLEPGLPFARPASVRQLELQLGEAPGAGLARPPAPARHSLHLGMFLILIAGDIRRSILASTRANIRAVCLPACLRPDTVRAATRPVAARGSWVASPPASPWARAWRRARSWSST